MQSTKKSGIQGKVKRIIETELCQSVLLNLLVLIVLLLLFEPTDKPDDFDMSMILYGAYNGKYSPYLLYSSPIMGKFMVFLLQWVSLPWYWIVYFVGMFLSFVAITYVLFQHNHGKRYRGLCFVLLCWSGYSFYIRCTFTKVAGIEIIAGLLLIFYAIDAWQKKFGSYLCGMLLIVSGILIRGAVFNLIIAVFFAAFIIFCIRSYKEQRKIWKEILVFSAITLAFMGVVTGIKAHTYAEFHDSEWSRYKEFNTARANVLDFPMADYEEYQEQYEELGISQNDYDFILKYHNLLDTERITEKFYKNVKSIYTVQEEEGVFGLLIKGLRAFRKNATVSCSMLFFFLLGCIALSMISSKEGAKRALIVSAFTMLCYLYMYYLGRIQEHTNDLVFFAAGIILLYWSREPGLQSKRKRWNAGMVLTCIILLSVSVKYDYISSSDYFGRDSIGYVKSRKEFYAKNYKRLALSSDDEKHLYLKETQDRAVNLKCFTVFQTYERGFYHNILDMSGNTTYPYVRDIFEKYDIKNPMREITNSDVLYYEISEKFKGHIDMVCKYIQENYNPEAYYSLVKKVDGSYVYRFNEGPIEAPWDEEKVVENAKIKSEISVKKTKKNTLKVSGYAFLEGVDSYSQNIYIKAVNNQTGEEKLAYGTQTENPLFLDQDKYHGKYSKFYGKIKLPSDFEDVTLYLYIDTADKTYKMKL